MQHPDLWMTQTIICFGTPCLQVIPGFYWCLKCNQYLTLLLPFCFRVIWEIFGSHTQTNRKINNQEPVWVTAKTIKLACTGTLAGVAGGRPREDCGVWLRMCGHVLEGEGWTHRCRTAELEAMSREVLIADLPASETALSLMRLVLLYQQFILFVKCNTSPLV